MLTNFYKSRLGALVHGRRWISIIWKSAAVTVEVGESDDLHDLVFANLGVSAPVSQNNLT